MVLDVEIFNQMRAYLLDRQVKKIAWYKKFIEVQVKLLARDLKQDMQSGVKTGRWYIKSDGSGRHRASAKGETPAVDTRKLLQSIKVKSKFGGLEVTASTNRSYVTHLIKMKRAFFKPFYNKRRSTIMSQLKEGGYL